MCLVCDRHTALGGAGSLSTPLGGVAQLEERLRGTQKVGGSSPLTSTLLDGEARSLGHFLGGVVAGEGSFYITKKPTPYRDGTSRPRFVFQVAMTRDLKLLHQLLALLGYGSLRQERVRNPLWIPAAIYTVASLSAHHAVTIPFAEAFLPRFSAKWRQYVNWRDALLQHEIERPTRYGKGRSRCSVEACDGLVRGRGLCRHHYYGATGY